MNNIQIDDTIINEYLNGNDVSIYRNDDIFSLYLLHYYINNQLLHRHHNADDSHHRQL